MNLLPVTTRVVDAHADGALTRIIVSGGPALAGATMTDRLADFNARHDAWRRALTGAPRSAPGTRAAVVTEAERPASLAGVLLFDDAGPAAIGQDSLSAVIAVIAALAHLGRVRPGRVQLDTPHGVVDAEFAIDGTVRVAGEDRTGRGHILFDGSMITEPDDPLGWGAPEATPQAAASAAVGGD